jgi:hypothetical protein
MSGKKSRSDYGTKLLHASPKTQTIFSQRIETAYEAFIESAMRFAECTRPQAEKIFTVYKKHKIIKQDLQSASYKVKHGVYWDKQTLWNAINFYNDEGTSKGE